MNIMSSETIVEQCPYNECNRLVSPSQSECPQCHNNLLWKTEGVCGCSAPIELSHGQCFRCGGQVLTWRMICNKVLNEASARENLTVPKESLPHPEVVGLPSSIGAPKGQTADYRISCNNGTCVHIREFNHHYKIHWDEKDPSQDPIGHLTHDAPAWGLALAGGAMLLAGHYSK